MSAQRLLAGLPPAGPMGLGEHREVHGEAPWLDRGDRGAFIERIRESGLRGRGGASFPTATKLAAVAGRRRAVVVVNGAEGEPMSAKDRALLTRLPHLVLDGALLAAQAVGVRDVVLAAPADVLPVVADALDERRRLGRTSASVRLAASAAGYVAGEETALLSHLEGRPAKPRVTPPLPAERGLGGRPTLVQNVETMAQLALIARHGAAWFRSAGIETHSGTTLVTVSGAVERPGVYEVDLGTPLATLPALAGGPLEPVRALLVGGYFGAWVEGDGMGLALDEGSLRGVGGGVGAGVVVVLGQSACPTAEVARLAGWLSAESAGQCGPCVNGLDGLATVLGRVATGRMEPGDSQRLGRWTDMVRGRGACRHPDGVAQMVASAARVFIRELSDHAQRGPCHACHAPPVLFTPAHARRAA